MPTQIELVSVYLMTPSLPEGCPPEALLEAVAEGLRRTQRFGAVQVERGPGPPAGHHVGIRIGTMKTIVGEMPKIELQLMDPSGALMEQAEPFGTKTDLPGAAADLALQFADEAIYPELMAARGHIGKREHPRVRHSNEQDAAMMGAALLHNLSNDVARGRDLGGTPMPPTFTRLVELGGRQANPGLLLLAADIVALWGDASAVLALLRKGHDALPEEKRPALARRLHGAVRQARQGAELAAMLLHLGALPGPFSEDNPQKHAVTRWLSITGLRSGENPDLIADLKDALGAAWARLPVLGVALAKPAPEEPFGSLLNACQPALAALGSPAELRKLAGAAGDPRGWRAAADEFLQRAERAAPLLGVEPWWQWALLGRAGAPEGRPLLERAIELSPRAAFLHEMLGLEHLCARDFEPAIAQLTKATTLQPESANAYNLRGASLSDQAARLDDAIRDLDRAIELDPTVALAWSNRAKTRGRQGRFEEALHDIEHALRLAPGSGDSARFRDAVLLDLERRADRMAASNDPAPRDERSWWKKLFS